MTEPSKRLLSLDALRGYTVAAMIIVNTPGVRNAIYEPLEHASWNGLTLTDLIFPFFLFIVGLSIALAYTKQLERGADKGSLIRKAWIRGLKIYAVGLFLNLWPMFNFGRIRYVGVLPRIAIVFAIVATLFVLFHRRWRALLATSVVLMVGYWMAMTMVPVPRDAVIETALDTGEVRRGHRQVEQVQIVAAGPDRIEANLEPGTNLAAWVDRTYLPGGRYERAWDPEGLLSTVPAMATTLLGTLIGIGLLGTADVWKRVRLLAGAAVACLIIGYAWATVFPLNKNLWSSSFVLVTAGWAMAGLGLATAMIDGIGWKRWAWPGEVFGANAITAYALAGMLTVVISSQWRGGVSPREVIVTAATSMGLPLKLASLTFAVLYAALIFLPVYVLHRKRIFIRL